MTICLVRLRRKITSGISPTVSILIQSSSVWIISTGPRTTKIRLGAAKARTIASRHISVTNFDRRVKTQIMKAGARNNITAKITAITSDKVMSLIKFEVTGPAKMASVVTTESVEELGLKIGDQVQLLIKAVHVIPIKE